MKIFSQEKELNSSVYKSFHIEDIVDRHCVLPDLESRGGGSCTKTEFGFTDEHLLKILLTSPQGVSYQTRECSVVGWVITY